MMTNPMENREASKANVSITFNCSDLGIDFALNMGVRSKVKLLIQVETLRRQ